MKVQWQLMSHLATFRCLLNRNIVILEHIFVRLINFLAYLYTYHTANHSQHPLRQLPHQCHLFYFLVLLHASWQNMLQSGFSEEEVEHNSPKHQCDLHNAHSGPWQTPATPATAETTRPTAFTSRWQSWPCVVWRRRIYSINSSWSAISGIHIEDSPLLCSQSQLSVLHGGKKDSSKNYSNIQALSRLPRGRACTTWLCLLDGEVYSPVSQRALRRIDTLINGVLNQDGGDQAPIFNFAARSASASFSRHTLLA